MRCGQWYSSRGSTFLPVHTVNCVQTLKALAVLPSSALFVAGEGGDGIVARLEAPAEPHSTPDVSGRQRRVYVAAAAGMPNWGPICHFCVVPPNTDATNTYTTTTTNPTSISRNGSTIYACCGKGNRATIRQIQSGARVETLFVTDPTYGEASGHGSLFC
jgi:hypothetical protein